MPKLDWRNLAVGAALGVCMGIAHAPLWLWIPIALWGGWLAWHSYGDGVKAGRRER
ncbi:hypothetical protein DS6A_4 [Mycobacterium phage DS6A]|uniref:Uncharacterized protein n=1 Tax=Mycobacterium phage DS6A TaxID=45764 RepID=G8I4B4_9CAUD|nr:hypothetical protein DS6A_4 [Mycobacterium phage DS6A]AER47558.1 hypothetical protein DS6A_4 [Mycobacterium phage DS6A]